MDMIKLVELLKENQYAPLYHATTRSNFLDIMNDGVIKPNSNGYVHVTRDKRYKVGGNFTPIIFKIDQEKIRQRHKITPTVGNFNINPKYIGSERVEAEEIIEGEIPLEWVEEIQIPKSIFDDLKEALQSFKEDLEWAKAERPQSVKTYNNSIKQYSKAVNFPKLSIY